MPPKKKSKTEWLGNPSLPPPVPWQSSTSGNVDDVAVTVIVCGHGDREATIRNLILDGDNNRQFDTVIASDIDVARQAMLHPKLKKFSKEVEVFGHEGEYWWLLGTRANKALGRA